MSATAETDKVAPAPDQPSRDAIERQVDATMHVSAGAGSGKTTALVARVLEYVRLGRPLDALVVITFSTAAASTLRTRIRQALLKAQREDPRLEYAAALDALQAAPISTLHAFARRVIAEFPVEANVPPGFDVSGPTNASIDFDTWWSSRLIALFDDPDLEWALERVDALEVRPHRYRDIACWLYENYDQVPPDIAAQIRTTAPPIDVSELLAAIDAYLHYCGAGNCSDPSDKLAEFGHAVFDYGAGLRATDDRHAPLELLDALLVLPKRASKGRQTSWRDVEEARRLSDAVIRAHGECVHQIVHDALEPIGAWIARAAVDVAAQRCRNGELVFHDLLVVARNLVRDHVTVRQPLHQRWPVILLDEFQDTDPLQIDLAARLSAADPTVEYAEWTDVEVAPGRLFTVGDPKQSIYRFRRADVALFNRAPEVLPGASASLTSNFRTRPGILAWINACVGAQFPAASTAEQTVFVPLDAMRPADPAVERPVVTLGGVHDKGTRSATVRRVEAADLAATVLAILGEGWPVEVADEAGDPITRPARLSDIAILMPTRALLPYLQAAFDVADIPLRVESQSLVYGTDDVRELLNVLAAIADPSDEVAVVAALRTSLFGCSDAALATWHAAGNRWRPQPLPVYEDDENNGRAPDDEEEREPLELSPVAIALATLYELHDAQRWQSVSETLTLVVQSKHVDALALGHARPRDHWQRVRFLLDKAREFEDLGLGGLRPFVRWVEQQIAEETLALEAVVADPDDDAVRVRTVHGAKGDEFPIVMLAGLGSAAPTMPPAVLHAEDGHLEIFLSKSGKGKNAVQTIGYDAEHTRDKSGEAAESLRVLYVAATRARDHLVVSLHHGPRAGNTRAGALAPLAEQAAELTRALDLEPWRTEHYLAPTATDAAPPRSDAEFAAEVAVFRAATIVTQSTNATAIARALDPGLSEVAAKADPADVDTPVWRRGRAGTAFGRAVHAVMQTIDLATGEGLADTARAQAEAEGIAAMSAVVERTADAMRRAPSVQEAITHRVWRELPVAAEIDGRVVEGFIDLLYETPAGLVVVDFKTDRARGEVELGNAVRRYGPQAATYALLLERTTGQRVHSAVFIFVAGDQPVECSLDGDELRAVIDGVAHELAG